jgi:hypothetical protein
MGGAVLRWARRLWTIVGQLTSAAGQPDAWIVGTGTIGRVGAARGPDSTQFESIDGRHRPGVYLDATWQLLE